MDVELKKVKDYVGVDSFNKGMRYFSGYIKYRYTDEVDGVYIHSFLVPSEHYYENNYDVEIQTQKREIVSSECTCMQFQSWGTCKHIAVCMIHFREVIFPMDPEEKKLYISKQILNEFYKPTKNEIHLKKQLQFEVELEFKDSYYDSSVGLTFKIGEDKLYNLNSKLSNFLDAYEEEEEFCFGKSFTYNPNEHFFSKTDEAILSFLLRISQRYGYYNYRNLSISMDTFPSFLELLKNKTFMIKGYGKITNIVEDNPLKLSLEKGEKYYKLAMFEQNIDFLTEDCKYVAKENTLYILPNKTSKILSLMQENQLHDLEFQEEDLTTFKEGILPILKNNVLLDKTVEDTIVLGIKPGVKIYLDFKYNMILCTLKFVYQETEIDYFVENTNIIRDTEEEKKVVEDLLGYGFLIDNQKIYMEDLDTIGLFLEESLLKLSKDYEVFTSDKMKETKIIKENNVRSSFSIGQDNIMSYQFDLGSIGNDEIVNVLESMKHKKRYYRLKSGDLLDLNQNEDLKQFETLVEDMNLSNKDIKNGSGVIPKYRAIYLDSLKKEKYHIISTNNLFDELIGKFNSYKDLPISLTSKDKKILRDYQEVGVKWLYNIYKCGFGGILADEMGLGKSIQLIYLIKEILKEKEDAKILIVAPTSLIYNWQKEFDKFGSEIKYKVFAENKTVRKQELESIGDTQVLITTYGLVRQDEEKYREMTFELMAIDEAQTIKNASAQMTKVVKELHANTKIALTGTPLENSVMELWSIFDFIMPGYLANFLSFQAKYNIKDIEEEELKTLDTLNEQIKPFILRRRKKDVVKELPPKIENNISIDLNKEQKKLYVAQLEKTKKEMDEILATEGFKKGNFKILQLLTKLRQLCIDPKILYENYEGGSAKIENLVSIVKGIIENGHKILLFTSFKTALDIVNQEFANNNISTYVIDGSVSSKKRMELVDKFNEDDTNVFLITLKAGGTGLNLTSADVVIHLDLWWNPQVENQATDRAHRIGQTHTVEVIKLICKGTIEERILELQNKKKILSDALIEGEGRDENILSKLTEKDIKNLLTLDNEE